MNSNPRLWRKNTKVKKWIQGFIVGIFALFALISILTTIGIVVVLVVDALGFFQDIPLSRFLTDRAWTPLFTNAQFGIFVLISATFLTSAIAILVALPLGLLAAICLSEYAPRSWRRWLKPGLELLAGVPTVVYGYFALLFVTPLLSTFIPNIKPFNALSAGLVLGVAILPTVASLSEDAIFAVPDSLRQGAYALGATKREVVSGVVIPSALSGIVASFILAVSRAVGETMIVTIAAGQNPTLTLNPLVPVATMTAYIVQVSLGDAPHGTLAFKTIYAVGLTLFLITLSLNILSYWFVRRFQQKYE
ncbi:phosphate ABC transporter permease subunit PstC [Gloeocapsa sp. PCC 73106]|uniref:phosphate ABC transporter permease subunit PstC n=1 Tax=Gloeocapsa sp. PCC 73106 TaxID=102232 RepID=UPI0002ABDB3B|nr:phosphate ABC transporter permease subunit PstC [Gloeocapsa sp. PCC 73106]ELR98481.1 phosphate ABC transporter, permease protein PstC [Gloeocapsa sp. PCC 73106]